MMFISKEDSSFGEMGAAFFSGFFSRWWKCGYNAESLSVSLGLSKFKESEGNEFVCTNLELSREVKTDDKKLRVKKA